MEITLTSDKNLATSSVGLVTSPDQLITVNSTDLLNIQVSSNGILPTSLSTSNGLPIISGSLISSSVSSPTSTKCSSMTAVTTMPVKVSGKSPTCKVCGDESSGFHYGVDSCEGCKGFFRRCITQGMTHKCSNEEKCEITPFTRNSCQYCRLKKCFEVGMSREASRLGRRPKRLKDSSGESKSQQVNLPIAPYPSPSELYKLRMAELQRLLQQNGTFKSELMQAFLSAAQVSFREHQRHNNNNDNKKANLPQIKKEVGHTNLSSPTSTTSSTSPIDQSTIIRNNNYQNVDNKDALLNDTPDNFLATQEANLLNRDIIPKVEDVGFPTIKTEPDYDNYCLSQTQSMTNTGSPSSPDAASPFNIPALSPETMMMMPDMMDNNSMQQMMGMMSGMMSGGFETPMDLPEPDPNANMIDVDRILEEVKQVPSELRSQLIQQVIETVTEAHLATVRPTYKSVAEANARLERMKADGELPDMSKLSINPDKVWQEFVESMVLEITAAVKFCKKLPGFGEIEQDDQIILIKKGSFEILNCRMCMLVDHINGTMFDPNIKMKVPRTVIKGMPMGFFIEEFFNVAEQFNPLRLTDEEIGIFSAVLMMCPERDGLRNLKAIEKLNTLYLQSLYVNMKQNHADYEDKFCKAVGIIPVFRYINQKHSMALNSMKMQNAQVIQEFPALHKEVYDLDK